MKNLKILFIPFFFFLLTLGCLEKSDTIYPDIVNIGSSAEKKTIQTSGGTIVFSKSGIQLDVERGDLIKSSEVTMQKYSSDTYPGQKILNTFSECSNYFTFENIFLKEGKQIGLTIPYDDSKITMKSSILSDETINKLNVYVFDSNRKKWLLAENGKTINSVSKTIYILTENLNAVIVAIDNSESDTATSSAKKAVFQ